MNYLNTYTILEDAFNNCILGDFSKEYVFDDLGVVLEVAPLNILQKLSVEILSSMTLSLLDGRYLICIAKEDIIAAPKEMQLMLMTFIFYHEIGHIVNGDQWDTNPDTNLIQEEKADEYSVKTLDLSSDEACQMIDYAFQRIITLVEDKLEKATDEKLENALNILKNARLSRMEYIKNI